MSRSTLSGQQQDQVEKRNAVPPASAGNGKMPPLSPKPLSFWAVFAALCVACLLSALDLTAVSTALPTIIDDLQGGGEFVWIGSAYTLTSTALMPISGPLANVFGRRPVLIFALVLFMAGSGLAGGAKHVVSMNLMIAARAIQGAGGGLILALREIVITDLCALRERGVYAGILGAVWALASAVGPPIGGALSKHWDWLFFLNLPLGVIAVILVWCFLHVKAPKEHWTTGLSKFDWVGAALIIGGSTDVILGLVWGGATYPWTSFRVLVPLIVGGVSLLVAFVWERKVAKNPIIPWEMIQSRTALSGHLATWLHGFVSIVLIYYLPSYFQMNGSSPIRSGVQLLPTAFTIAPAAIAIGVIVTITGKYRTSNYVGWMVTIVGWGLLSLLKIDTPTYAWVLIQLVLGVGIGIVYSSTLFPVLAPVPLNQGPHAMGFYVFMRNFGQTFGVSIGGVILQNQLSKKLPREVASQIHVGGSELSFAIIPLIKTLSGDLQVAVRIAFNDSLRLLWLVMIGFSAAGLLTVLLMKEIPLQTETSEEWGLEDRKGLKQPDTPMSTA